MKTALPTATIEFDGSANAIDNPENEDGLPNVELRYTVKGINESGSDITLSQTFDSLVQLLKDQVLTDFALTRTTMEQVFINFAKFQVAQAIEGDAMP